jgi:hypothetical protein
MSEFNVRQATRRAVGKIFALVCFTATAIGIIVLAVLLIDIWRDGAARLSLEFLSGFPSRIVRIDLDARTDCVSCISCWRGYGNLARRIRTQ